MRVFSSFIVSFSLPMISRSLQGLFGLAGSAQDHEVVGVGHEPRAEGSLKPELSIQHKPAHLKLASNGEITPRTQKAISASIE